MSWCLMLHLPSKNLEGRRRDQGSRHRSISSQVWLVECPRPQLSSTVDYWRSFQPFPFTLLFDWRLWCSNEVDDLKEAQYWLRSSASSCWACFCLFLLGTLARCLRGLEIVWHCITQAIKRKEPEYCILRRIPDLWSPQFQGAFVTFTLTSRRRLSIAQWWMCQFGSAGRQVGEGGCWCRDQPRHIDVHRLVKTGCFTCSLPPFLEVLVWFSSPVRSDCYGYLLPD